MTQTSRKLLGLLALAIAIGVAGGRSNAQNLLVKNHKCNSGYNCAGQTWAEVDCIPSGTCSGTGGPGNWTACSAQTSTNCLKSEALYGAAQCVGVCLDPTNPPCPKATFIGCLAPPP